ncbi:S-layer homology domain-containing protein [Virgibacillus halodenitrificans]|uniref:S-layer homology domain-containing protein n=1 Tax=Virgibacillus halodenitrificans TaxID=1482 RepID=UPI000EF4FE39|nr:S-layer homology domain-containing protein [Virgibacillus halodenitrificans]
MKKWIAGIVMLAIFLVLLPTSILASEKQNPPLDEIRQKLADEARKQGIPPEILKAIAETESQYKQFNKDGTPNITPDGGIGIMQVTPANVDIPVDVDRLKTDIDYNIEIGAKVLLKKWNLSYLPKINNHDKSVLENWYFAIMAYNGLSKRNDPSFNPNNAYQERVYARIESASLLYISDEYFSFPAFDIRYEENDERMFFPPDKNYQTTKQINSQEMYKKGDIIYLDERDESVLLRDKNLKKTDINLWPYTPLTITGSPKETSNYANDFAYYPVKGVTANGYVASSYANKGDKSLLFSDPIDDKRAAALAFAALNDYVQGYPDGSFGSQKPLKREHVAVMLDSILNLQVPYDYQMAADDVKKNNPYYNHLKKAEYNKLLGGGGKLRPEEHLTRSQMAQVMSEAFADHYATPSKQHIFDDQRKIWNPEAVNTIYDNDVTIADPFRPTEEITRSQFAIFIYRTLVNY